MGLGGGGGDEEDGSEFTDVKHIRGFHIIPKTFSWIHLRQQVPC